MYIRYLQYATCNYNINVKFKARICGFHEGHQSCTFENKAAICNKSGVLKSCRNSGPNPYHVKHHAQHAAQVITILFHAVKCKIYPRICEFGGVTSVVHAANYLSLRIPSRSSWAKVGRKVAWRPSFSRLNLKWWFVVLSQKLGPEVVHMVSKHIPRHAAQVITRWFTVIREVTTFVHIFTFTFTFTFTQLTSRTWFDAFVLTHRRTEI